MPGQRTEKDPSPATEHTKRESPNFKAYVVVILGHQAPKHKARSPKPETLELACGGWWRWRRSGRCDSTGVTQSKPVCDSMIFDAIGALILKNIVFFEALILNDNEEPELK